MNTRTAMNWQANSLWRRAGYLLLLTASLVMLGCNSGSGPAPVQGTVTLDGEPLDGAMVEFTPTGGRPSAGRTDAEGKYELVYSRQEKGAMPGEHSVSIRTYREGDPDSEANAPSDERVPAKYNANTTLTETVEPGRNTIDFDLDSEGEIILPPGAGG